MATDTTELSLASLELDKLEACVELMFLAAYADGTVAAEERALFEEHVRRATRGQLGPDLIHAVLAHIEATVQSADRPERVRFIAARLADPRLRRAALSLAATVAGADGTLHEEERAFLEAAGAAFGIAGEELSELLAGPAT